MKRKLYVLLILYIFLSFFTGTASGYQKNPQDIKIVQDIKIMKEIKIIDDDKVNIVNTSKRNVEQLLLEQKISINKGDVINLKLEHELTDGMVLQIQRAKNVTLLIDGKKTEVSTTKKTVGDLISEYIDIVEDNYVLEAVAEGDPITNGLEIVLNLIVEFERSIIEFIPFEKEERYTDELFEGETRVLHQGINGKVEKVYNNIYINNNKEDEIFVASNVLELPANEVIEIGTKPRPKTIHGLVYSKEFDMIATAYTSYKKGGSYTYTGVLARVGIVAVDPKVIPLGSKLYIEGYGQAIAGDTGGVIKGNKIDVYLNTMREAINYGIRKVKVYLLED